MDPHMFAIIRSQVLDEVSSKVSSGGARTSLDTWLVQRKQEEPSRSLMSASTASCSQWRTSRGGISQSWDKTKEQ